MLSKNKIFFFSEEFEDSPFKFTKLVNITDIFSKFHPFLDTIRKE